MQPLEALQYPIGRFETSESHTPDDRRQSIAVIAGLPEKLAELLSAWNDDRLDTPYRPGGWTVRQLVHHVADSHINAYVRLKLALTEENPTIKPYEEGDWAALPDSSLGVDVSLTLLRAVHQRWVTILNALADADWQRTYYHPGSRQLVSLAEMTANYAWHSEHHYQHAYRLAQRSGWV